MNTVTQAQRIISAFGSPYKLSKALAKIGVKRSPVAIYKWLKSKAEKGTGGYVPSGLIPNILSAAAASEPPVVLTEKMLSPLHSYAVAPVEPVLVSPVSALDDIL